MPSQSRELRKQQDRQASWDRLRLEPWRPHDTQRAFGSGRPRIQIVRLPSFSPPSFWEVCQLQSEWLLYSATVVNPDWSLLTVRGYEAVKFDGHKLKDSFDRIVGLSMPVAPYLNNMAGLDGTVTQLALFGDLWSQVRYQWWSDHPPGWTPMVEVVNEMLAAFGDMVEGE